MFFEWEPDKAAENLRKHGVSFEEAVSIFFDSLSATAQDRGHELYERRFVTFGLSLSGRLLAVAHTERRNRIRLITAREATRAERKLYEEG